MNQRWILARLDKDYFGIFENLGSVLMPQLVMRCTCNREDYAREIINRLNGLPPQAQVIPRRD